MKANNASNSSGFVPPGADYGGPFLKSRPNSPDREYLECRDWAREHPEEARRNLERLADLIRGVDQGLKEVS